MVLAWIFVLGVLVGRGDIPNPLEMSFLKKLLATNSPQSSAVVKGNPKTETQEPQPQPKLDFYEDLNKERAEVRGVIPKEPESAKPSENLRDQATERSEEKKMSPRYIVQLASFKDKAKARLFMEQMNKKDIPCELSTVNSNGVIWYRVRTGSFQDLASAKVFSLSLKEKHRLDPMVVSLP